MTAESVTILRATPTLQGAPRHATKRWIWDPVANAWRKIAYEAGGQFTAEECPVGCLDDLARVVESVRRDPTAFLVRGELLPEVRAAVAENPDRRIRRAKMAGRQGQAPSLVECSRRWLMLDIDNYPMPGWADLIDDPEAVVEAAIYDLLPPCFHDVQCFWQLSASAGFTPGALKIHLFFWLSAPVSNDDLRAYFQVHAPGIDRALFNAAQVHYVADPIVEGAPDPIPRRTGWVKGLDSTATLPAFDPAALRATIHARRQAVTTGAGLDPGATRTVAGALALLGDDVGREGWHAPLLRATILYAGQASPQGRDDEAMKAACRAAIRAAAEREAGQHAASDLARFCSDAYLDHLIGGAFDWIKRHKGDVPEGLQPFHAAPTHDVKDARIALRQQLAAVLEAAEAWHAQPEDQRGEPRHVGFGGDVGLGKSQIARELVADSVRRQKQAGRPHRLGWLVETLELGGEAAAHFATMPGITVAVQRGREQPDPNIPGKAMCLDLPAAKLATAAGESVETAVCGSGKDGATSCRFRGTCGYMAQRKPVAQADVVIAAHEAAFHLPGGMKNDLFLVVCDESWWQAGLMIGRDIAISGLADDVLRHQVLRHIPGGGQVVDIDATDALHALRSRLERALAKAPAGYLRRQDLVGVGLTTSGCAAARAHEWARKREGLMQPAMAPKDRTAAAAAAGANARVARYAAMWGVLADFLAGDLEVCGRAELGDRRDRNGEMRWSISLNTIRPVVAQVQGIPVVALDAVLPVDLVRHYLPRLEAPPAVRVHAPHMRVHQLRGGWGKNTLLPESAPDCEMGHPVGRLAVLRDFVAGETQGERALVITYMAAEGAFAGLPGVEVAHFNAIAGKDGWRDVRHEFVLGAPRPGANDVRRMAAALTGEPVPLAESHRETRGVRMRDGTVGAVEVRAYAHPAAEAVSVAITEAETMQAIGRARGNNRGVDDPVNLWLMAGVVLPLVVDELLDWPDVEPGAVERMGCRAGVILTSPADAARVFPDLFSSAKAAEHALQRAGIRGLFPPHSPNINSIRGMGGKYPLAIAYRPPGRGQQIRHARVRANMDLAEIRAWLEAPERLGPLAVFSATCSEAPAA